MNECRPVCFLTYSVVCNAVFRLSIFRRVVKIFAINNDYVAKSSKPSKIDSFRLAIFRGWHPKLWTCVCKPSQHVAKFG